MPKSLGHGHICQSFCFLTKHPSIQNNAIKPLNLSQQLFIADVRLLYYSIKIELELVGLKNLCRDVRTCQGT